MVGWKPAGKQCVVLFVLATLLVAPLAGAQQPYFPPPGDAWERRTPEQVGLDPRSVGERQILSEAWIRMATTPGVNRGYGFMNYFLNTGRRGLPSAPEEAFWHLGGRGPLDQRSAHTRWGDRAFARGRTLSQVLICSLVPCETRLRHRGGPC